MEKFFAVEPYKSYREYFNVYTVTAVSANEVYETGSATVFSCYFGGGTHVGGDDAKVFTYAQKAISEDKIDDAVIIVMMNSTQYAGTCWLYFPASGDGDYGSGASISYFPVGEDETMLKQVLQHEACGHGFAKLGDEYQDMFMEEIPESMITLAREQEKYGWLKNIDFTSDSTKVKWNKFLFDARYANEGLGVYEGANTYSKGVYRSSWSSIMRDHKGGFNAPSREAIYYRLHKLAYGTEWQYDYEKFVQYDSINLTPASKSIILRSTTGEQRPPLPAPVVIRSSWRNAKSNVPSKSAAGGVNHGLLRGNARQVSPASAAFASPILTRRVPLPDGRTAITTIDASGKTKVTYENKESK